MEKNSKAFKEVQLKINCGPRMQKNQELQDAIHLALTQEAMNSNGSGVYTKLGRYIKLFSYLVLFTGISIIFNSCAAGYVSSEPGYVEYDRPQQPGGTYIWIDGGWRWDTRSHIYVQRPGYWERPRPRQHRSYIKGYWESTPRGKYWHKGHWQREQRQEERHEK
jgi:hypothetical protein